MSKERRLGVYLTKQPTYNPLGHDEGGSVELVMLTPYHYGLPYFTDFTNVYTIYSPPQDRLYEDWEISIMRGACKAKGVKFQLHPPPVTQRNR